MGIQYKTNGEWKDISSSSNNTVDAITNGNMNPVTSNAVYDLLRNIVGPLNIDSTLQTLPTTSTDNAVYPGVYLGTGPETYGVVLVLGNHTTRLAGGNTWIYQIFFGTSGNIYTRQAINPNTTPPASNEWTTWRTINKSPRSAGMTLLTQNVALPSGGFTFTAASDGIVVVHAYKKSGGNTLNLRINNVVVDSMPFNVPTMLGDCYGCQINLRAYCRKGDSIRIDSDGNQSLYWIQKAFIQTQYFGE